MDKKAIAAGINYMEFRFREADFSSFPKGLMYGIDVFDSWLYDDEKPFLHVEAIETFDFLKEQVGNGYFEQLIQKYFHYLLQIKLSFVNPSNLLLQLQISMVTLVL